MNIQSLLDERGVAYKTSDQHHHARPGWIGVDCSWCGPRSGKYHLGIRLEGGYCVCWRCGYHSLADVLTRLLDVPLRDALRLVEAVGWRGAAPGAERARARELVMPPGVGGLSAVHRRYLVGRGLDPDQVAERWGVRGIGLATQPWAWRLWIPIHHHGETVSWTTRSVAADADLRYISAAADQETYPAKRLLYGADHARLAIVVVEGPVDCWAIGHGAVATLGTGCSRAQLMAMAQYPRRVICFDAEPAAQRRARRLAAELEPWSGETTVIELATGKDAASADKDEVAELRERFLE